MRRIFREEQAIKQAEAILRNKNVQASLEQGARNQGSPAIQNAINTLQDRVASIDFHRIVHHANEILSSSVMQDRIKDGFEVLSKIDFDKIIGPNLFDYYGAQISNFHYPQEDYQSIINNLSDYYLFNSDTNVLLDNNSISPVALPLNETLDNTVFLTRLLTEISAKECVEYQKFLTKYPMLGLTQPIGDRILKAIKALEKKEIINIDLYRCKKPYKGLDRGYDEKEMYQSPFLHTPQGRFSPVGIDYLYFSETLETAMEEIELTEKEKFTYIHVNLLNQKRVVDITDISIPLCSSCTKKKTMPENTLEINYLIPNFISNCAAYLGYDGIVSLSTKDFKKKNYTFFNSYPNDFKCIECTCVNFD